VGVGLGVLSEMMEAVEKMNKAVLHDLEQLQKDLSSTGTASAAAKPSSTAKRGASKRSSTAKRTSSKTRLRRHGESPAAAFLVRASVRARAMVTLAWDESKRAA
jgi:hypothetical protein